LLYEAQAPWRHELILGAWAAAKEQKPNLRKRSVHADLFTLIKLAGTKRCLGVMRKILFFNTN
jgi:hypothetical protein